MKKYVVKLVAAGIITLSCMSSILAACPQHLVLRDNTGATLVCTLVQESSKGICIYECGAVEA